MDRLRHIFNQTFLIYTLLWPTLQNNLLHGIDGAGRLTIIMMFFAFFANLRYFGKAPRGFILAVVWAVYAALNTFLKGHNGITGVSYPLWALRSLFFPIMVLYVAYFEFSRYWNGNCRMLLLSMLIFLVTGAVFLRPTLQEDLSLRIMNALGNDYFNSLFILPCCAFILFIEKKLKLLPLLFIILSVFVIIVIGAERKSLGAFAITIIFCLVSYTLFFKKNILLLVGSFAILAIAMYFVMTYTFLGERIVSANSNTVIEDNLFLKLMGDRGIQYQQSWDMFLRHPLTGIGLFGYSVQNTHFYGLPLHSEYMVQLAECGLVGAMLKLFALINLLKQFVSLKNFDKKVRLCNLILLGGVLAILFINLTAWSYDMCIKYLLFAMVYAYGDRCRLQSRIKRYVRQVQQ